jgi:DNA-binding XRE family transcriptional regulator
MDFGARVNFCRLGDTFCFRRLGLARSLLTAPVEAALASPKGEIVRQPYKRNSIRPARTHRERSSGAQLRLSCAAQRSQHRRAVPESFLFVFCSGVSMHPHPSFEVPRCRHCGLIQFRHTIAKCVRCKKPLDNLATGMFARSFASDRPKQCKEALGQRVGVAVKSLRKERKFTQQRLAILMGTGRSYISKLESGRVVPSLQTLQRATSAFGIDLAELFLRLRRQT